MHSSISEDIKLAYVESSFPFPRAANKSLNDTLPENICF